MRRRTSLTRSPLRTTGGRAFKNEESPAKLADRNRARYIRATISPSGARFDMKYATTALTISLLLLAPALGARSADLEARINELEAALDHLQDRIEQLEKQQTPSRMSEAEAEAVLRKKQVKEQCAAQLGPAPEFAPVLGTKVNPDYMAYLKKHRACVRSKETP